MGAAAPDARILLQSTAYLPLEIAIVAIRPFQDMTPRLGERVFIDDSAVVIGDVSLGDDSSVWPLARRWCSSVMRMWRRS